ncbi:MAG: UvrD-helicase domain-containing protein, partial [Pseudomonadota bacterium]
MTDNPINQDQALVRDHDRANEPDWLAGLNEAQRMAVAELDGPSLVLAGAGTGKTRVLATRLARLIHEQKAAAWQILCVTFTNKAAREMRERIEQLIGPNHHLQWVGTFHSLSARQLRRHSDLAGLPRDFVILDSDDQQRVLLRLMREAGLDDKKHPPRLLLHHISRWKDRALGPGEIPAELAGSLAGGRAIMLYQAYCNELRQLGAVDFGDLIMHMITIFKQHGDVLAEWQRRFRYLLVDEYQDINTAQYLWLRLLAQGTHNLCCVGDDDQSIYGWRGAEIENILRFERDFPGANITRLEQNYRSNAAILNLASSIIGRNEQRLGKLLWTENDQGDLPIIQGVWDGGAEARFITGEIARRVTAGQAWHDHAVLVRMGFLTRQFEEEFVKNGVPYQIFGGQRFYEREEIRDLLAYLRLALRDSDDLAFERIINKPRRGIGASTLRELFLIKRIKGESLMAAARQASQAERIRPAAKKALSAFCQLIDGWRDIGQDGDGNHGWLARHILESSGYLAMLEALPVFEYEKRLENIRELLDAITGWPSLASFLEHVALATEADAKTSETGVRIMTLHAAKGLEFDSVFLPGWEDGLFPSKRAIEEKGAAGLEEERRLAYVGITRAQKQLCITFAASRQIYGRSVDNLPSRFL